MKQLLQNLFASATSLSAYQLQPFCSGSSGTPESAEDMKPAYWRAIVDQPDVNSFETTARGSGKQTFDVSDVDMTDYESILLYLNRMLLKSDDAAARKVIAECVELTSAYKLQ